MEFIEPLYISFTFFMKHFYVAEDTFLNVRKAWRISPLSADVDIGYGYYIFDITEQVKPVTILLPLAPAGNK